MASTAAPAGLSQGDADRRLRDDGPNEPTPPRPRTLGHIALEVAREPMFQLLVAAGLLYVLLGDLGEASMLLAFVVVTLAITVLQERRTERALEALRDLTSPRALVLRDGQPSRIAGREVVRGDLLILAEGDRIAADARLLSANDLRVDESLLTGESVPVDKRAGGEPAARADGPGGAAAGATQGTAPGAVPGVPSGAPSGEPGDDSGFTVYAGTMVVGGQGLARVVETGAATEVGRIGRALGTIAAPPTPLSLQVRRLVRVFSVAGIGLSVVVALLYGATRSDWAGAVLAGITLAMSMLPQEFLLILTVYLAMGAWRLSSQRVLTRHAAAIEALGSATVLCTDKTGTLTRNRMEVAELAVPAAGGWVGWSATDGLQRHPELPVDFHELVEFGLLASESDPFDPMDRAFGRLASERLPAARRHADWTLVHDYGLGPALLAMTHVWQPGGPGDAAGGGQGAVAPKAPQVVAVKGAVEAVAQLCRLAPEAAQAISDATATLAARGLRVLAVAGAAFDNPAAGSPAAAGPAGEATAWPATPHGFDFGFIGLVGLADPLRDGVPAAVRECREAGIRVVMITGDHPATALAIAAQAGIDAREPALAGAELAGLDDAELHRRAAVTTVFARVRPEQKLRIVQALKSAGQVVAMTGDGVNDAPSLKAAHIGIAMGGRGTDVAREAASLVLLDDDFGSIVRAVRLGRRIDDNLRKAMAFVLAVHVPIAGLSLLPLLLGLPLVFTPVHIAFLELLIDPTCSFVFESEPEEGGVMRRPPRDPAAPLFSRRLIAASLAQGVLVLAGVGALFVGVLRGGASEPEARAVAFTALVLCSLALIVANRALDGGPLATLRRPNPWVWRVAAATLALLVAALAIEPLRVLFRFQLPPPMPLALAAALAVGVWMLLGGLRSVASAPAPTAPRR